MVTDVSLTVFKIGWHVCSMCNSPHGTVVSAILHIHPTPNYSGMGTTTIKEAIWPGQGCAAHIPPWLGAYTHSQACLPQSHSPDHQLLQGSAAEGSYDSFSLCGREHLFIK